MLLTMVRAAMNGFYTARGIRLVLSCLALIFLTNCARLHLTQGPEEMLVRVGSLDKTLWAPPYADNFLEPMARARPVLLQAA